MKVLYDRGFVVSESIDFSEMSLSYESYEGGHFSFSAASNNTEDLFERMEIKEGFEKQSPNFTVEIYSKYEKDYNPHLDRFCKDNSSKALRNLIKHCWARTLLREMTDEEKEQMRKFKKEQQSKQNF